MAQLAALDGVEQAEAYQQQDNGEDGTAATGAATAGSDDYVLQNLFEKAGVHTVQVWVQTPRTGMVDHLH